MIAPYFCISAVDVSQLAGESLDRAEAQSGLAAFLARVGKRIAQLLS